MNVSGMLSIAKKELRSAFLSPVALIFIGVFLMITLFSFFTQSRFFVRGIADVRPLFEWMPLLLIFLVSAVSMRAWSEESRSGTLELLLTLPLKSSELVFGKFLAGLGLVMISLALTLPIPLVVADLGPLDWGPVIGGYSASLLLASGYLAIGLCVSAFTDHQIVSLMLSLIICGALYLIGADAIQSVVGHDLGQTLTTFGTGARFESVERGVLDVSDLTYFLSITVLGLYLNTIAVERKRIDRAPTDRISRWGMSLITGALIAANLVFANLNVDGAHLGRIDLTQDELYSVSETTEEVIANLSEEMKITGYFSERTHPALAPLVPQIRDMLEEYAIKGGDRLKVDFVNPHRDEALEEELGSQFGIEPVQISLADRTEMSFVNMYFHILIEYGDEHKVLKYDDLIDIQVNHQSNELDVRLKGFEYTLTKAIKAISQEFLSLEALMATQPTKFTAYVTQGGELPAELKQLPELLKGALDTLKQRAESSAGTFSYEIIDPQTLDEAAQARLIEEHGFMPIQTLESDALYWFYGLVEVGQRDLSASKGDSKGDSGSGTRGVKTEGLTLLQRDLTEEKLLNLIESSIRRCAPGFRKTIGLLTESKEPPAPAMPYGQPPQPPQADYQLLERALSAQFDVKRVALKGDLIPSDIDALIVAKPGELNADQRFAIDQYLMGGGAVIALATSHKVELDEAQMRRDMPPQFKGSALKDGLAELLKHYGVEVEPSYLLDDNALNIIYPIIEGGAPFGGGFQRIQLAQVRYPHFVQVTRDLFPEDPASALAGLNSVSVLWPSPLKLAESLPQDMKARVLLESSERAWLSEAHDLSPVEALSGAERARRPLVVALEGSFSSAFNEAQAKSKVEDKAQDEAQDKTQAQAEQPTQETSALRQELAKSGRVLNRSVAGAKLAVIGSTELVSDLGLRVGQLYNYQGLQGDYESGLQLLYNLIEWSVADDALASIRTGGPASRVLRPIKPEEQRAIEFNQYLIALVALIILALINRAPRHFQAVA